MSSCNAETRDLPHAESVANPSSCNNSFANGSNDVQGDGTSNDVEYCKTSQILSICDHEIFMTKVNLIKNLATIATSAFEEKMQTCDALNLSGQFGTNALGAKWIFV